MYTIGVRIGLFLRKIKVLDHKLGESLHYATKNGRSVMVPYSALKKFVLYPDFWDHQKKLEMQERDRRILEEEAQRNDELARELTALKEENKRLKYAQVQTPVVTAPVISPNRQGAEAYDSLVMKRARERMDDGL
jgi:cell shape-determining protein MreC